MNNDNTFDYKMYKKGSHEVDRIFQYYFNEPQNMLQHRWVKDSEITALMIVAYLRGVNACISDIRDYFNLNDKNKSLMQ